MPLDIILSVLPTILEYTIAPIKRHISYPFKYKSNIENLKEEVQKLTNARERMQHSIDNAKRNGEVILRDVDDWLLKVDGTTEKMAGELAEDEDRAKKTCFVGLCPNFMIRYQISKKAEKEAMAVADLRKKGVFDTVSHRPAPQGMESMSAKDYETLESRRAVFKEIMDALTVTDVNMIGVYGMGGVGKTTLVKEVGRQAEEDKLFDRVIMATVTQAMDVRNIQGQISDMLGLKFDEESEKGRAGRLRERLKQEKKILVILDDLWEKLNLEAVGIPFVNEHKGCKIVLTSRDLNVLSSEMDSQKNFPVGVLPEEEAWNFFKKMAGDNFENLDLQSVAIEVAKECAGLPVSIVTVARALKNKSLPEWKNALRELKRPSSRNFTGMQKIVYSTIEFSYNHLENEELKSTFLLCSQMGYDATSGDLLKYGVGLGLFQAAVTLEEAQDRVHSLVKRLRDSCLLLDSNVAVQLTMHDVVRDVAISIASRDRHVFTMNNEVVLKEWPHKDISNSCTAIWLRCNIVGLPEELHYPQLDLFHIESKDPGLKMPDKLFRGMHELRVLDLNNFSFSSLPSSLGLLKKLRTLCLHQSVLRDIGIIGELQQLEILSFAKSNIKHLPREIGQLAKLQVLDLSNCFELEVIPPNIISNLSLLEELYMGNSFDQWEIEGLNNHGQNNASLAELKDLSHLSNLEVQIPDAGAMPTNLFSKQSKQLQRYKIFIGDVWDWKGTYETLRILKLKLNTSIHLENGVQMLLRRAEDLYLHELKGVKNILYELNEEGFPQLKHLRLHNSPEIQFIINTMERVPPNAFPMLESLILYKMVSLEKICHGGLGAPSFSKLRVIKINNCDSLKYLFSISVVQALLQLEDIEVTSCQKIEGIVAEGSEVNANNSEVINNVEFAQLHSLQLQGLPLLRNFNLSQRRSMQLAPDVGSKEINLEDEMRTHMPLFDEKIAFPNLKHLLLDSINIDKLWHGQFPAIRFSVQKLTSLYVWGCHRLKYLFTTSMVKSLVQLKYLWVQDCKLMEEIIVIEGLGEEEKMSELFPELQGLHLLNLPKLAQFCSGHRIEFPSLKQLMISHCSAMKTFISNFTGSNMTASNEPGEENLEENHQNVTQPLFDEKVAFPSLAEINIYSMDNLEKIWHSQPAGGSFYQLKTMRIISCGKLVNIFPPNLLGRFQRLEQLDVHNCGSVEEIFELQGLSVEEAYPLVAFHLRNLSLGGLHKLKNIWTKDPQGILTFRDLHSVSVNYCKVLNNIFPSSIARDLLQIEELEIFDCGVEEIIAKEENVAAVPCFMFPKLISLKLKNLSKLRSFYPGTFTSKWPMLKNLKVGDIGNVKLFASEFRKFHKTHGEGQLDVQNQQPLFLVEKVIPNLEVLLLDGKDTSTSIIWHCQFPAEIFSTLKVLKLSNFEDKSDVFPFGFFQRLPNLEKLVIKSTSFEDLFSYEGHADEVEHTHTGTLSQLRNLEIVSVHDRRVIWEQHYRLDLLFQNLENLEVRFCDSLVSLATSSAPFQKLTTLKVSGCKGLLNLVTSSAAKSLVNLIKLVVEDCNMVREIVTKQGDKTKEEIIFSKLESLKLLRLKILTSFCSGNYTFKFPSLKKVIVNKCPKMRTFSPGVLSTPKLRGVNWKRYSNEEVRWEGNLNTTIQLLYTEMVGFDRVWDLKLSEFPELKEIWHVKLPIKFFLNLQSLEVDECAFFSYAVPSNLLLSLNNLHKLSVRNCDSLEGVFNLEELSADAGHVGLLPKLNNLYLMNLPRLRQIWNKDPRGILDFKNLCLLKIHDCSSLRSIFAPSMALCLVQLEKMEIRNCALMEEIITKERSEEAVTYEIIFPQLASIILESLPNLTNIYSGSSILKFPSLKEIAIDNCPNMKTLISSLLRGQEPKTVDEGKEQRLGKVGHDIPNALLFNDKLVFPNLEKLRVEWNDTMEEIGHGQFQAEFFCRLKVLELIRFPDEYAVFPSHFLQRFPSLENLILSNALFEEIIPHDETNSNGVLPQLRELKLSNLPKLVHLSKDDSQPRPIFQNLETLKLSECGILNILVPSSVSFQFLKTLEVQKCHGLANLMTSSSVKYLVELTMLSLTECELIEKIVANQENEEENGIIFNKLECLRLHCLPSLIGFCLENCTLMFPSLKEVLVRECPKMKIFARGIISTPKLERVQLTKEDKGCWEGSLNASIQKLYETGQAVAQSNTPSSSNQPTLDFEATQAEKSKSRTLDVSEGIASEDFLVTENPDASKDLPPEVETTIRIGAEQTINCILLQPEIAQLASTCQGYHASSNDKEDPRQDQNFSTPIIIETSISPQVEKGSKATDKNETQKDQVMPASSIQQSSTTQVSPATAVDEQALVSSSASPTKTTSFQELVLSTASRPISEIPPLPITERSSHSPANFESLFASMEQLLKRSPAPSSQPSTSANIHVKSNESNASFEMYGYSMALMKEILMKPLAEVARSHDGLLLLSTLKNLKNCPLLNSQQLEIIQIYIESFDTLVTNHPFYEQQIDRTIALKVFIEEGKKGSADIWTLYEDLTSKTSTLSADKEVLKKRLHEIEEEEKHILANMEDLYAQLVARKGKLETCMNSLPEAERQQREAEDRASNANDYWAKIRSLFA